MFIIMIIIIQTLIIYVCYFHKIKREKREIMEIKKNFYNEILENLYSQYSKAIDELNLEKASFLLHNIRIVKFGNDKKENKDV
jgi:hypothetical protein